MRARALYSQNTTDPGPHLPRNEAVFITRDYVIPMPPVTPYTSPVM